MNTCLGLSLALATSRPELGARFPFGLLLSLTLLFNQSWASALPETAAG